MGLGWCHFGSIPRILERRALVAQAHRGRNFCKCIIPFSHSWWFYSPQRYLPVLRLFQGGHLRVVGCSFPLKFYKETGPRCFSQWSCLWLEHVFFPVWHLPNFICDWAYMPGQNMPGMITRGASKSGEAQGIARKERLRPFKAWLKGYAQAQTHKQRVQSEEMALRVK